MSMMPGQGPAMGLPPAAGAAPPMPGLPPGAAPPPAMMGRPQFPSLDPNYMAQLVAPVAQQMQADQDALKAQQQAVTGSLIDAMSAQPNPAAEAAMVEPGAPTSPLGPPDDQLTQGM